MPPDALAELEVWFVTGSQVGGFSSKAEAQGRFSRSWPAPSRSPCGEADARRVG